MPIHAITPGATLAQTTLTWRCWAPSCPQQQQPQPLTLAQVPKLVSVNLTLPALTVTCPACGAVECLNLAFTVADEDATTPTPLSPVPSADRGLWIKNLRALMRVVGLTPA